MEAGGEGRGRESLGRGAFGRREIRKGFTIGNVNEEDTQLKKKDVHDIILTVPGSREKQAEF